MQLRQLIRKYRILAAGVPQVEFIALRTPSLQVDGQINSLSGVGTQATLAYSASMTPDMALGNTQRVTIGTGVAFAINAPLNPPATGLTGLLTFIFENASGGAAGAATWNAAFHLAGAWTAPASTKYSIIQFQWDATDGIWIETFRSAADIT